MIVLAILLHLLVILASLLLALILVLLFVPIDYESQGFLYEEDMGVTASVGWLFGGLEVRFSKGRGTPQSFEMRILGCLKKNLNTMPTVRSEKKKNDQEKKKSKKAKKTKAPFTKEKLMAILKSVKRILKAYKPRYFSLDTTVGFDDAYHTGLLCAGIETLKPVLDKLGEVRIKPVFDDEIFEGRYDVAGRMMLGIIALEGLRIIFSKPFRKNIFKIERKYQHV
ncbi:MAG: DUF2953 domain-containing protein [Clostridia bacterium]|nr:DUF2953 domain-containing protein [Clostridia bacterium]